MRNETCTFDAISRFGGVRDTSVWTLSGLTLKQLSGLDVYLHSALRESSLGEEGRHPDVPVLITSSITDDVISRTEATVSSPRPTVVQAPRFPSMPLLRLPMPVVRWGPCLRA
ncbi:hypothetical protein ACIP5Z_10710 [Rothia terrae]|uniref:hypothetical protein n=1 Tax=Rothia terrae TaxID=396015 RepID=UPI0038172D30